MTDQRARSGRFRRVQLAAFASKIRGGGFVAVDRGSGEGSARVRGRVAPSCRRPWCSDGRSRRSVPPPNDVRGEGTPPGLYPSRDFERGADTKSGPARLIDQQPQPSRARGGAHTRGMSVETKHEGADAIGDAADALLKDLSLGDAAAGGDAARLRADTHV